MLLTFDDAVVVPSDTPEEYDILRLPDGDLAIQYDGGTLEDRGAIVEEGNLCFYIKNPTATGSANLKGRVQLNIITGNILEAYYKTRMYIHQDVNLLSQYSPAFTWYTLGEMRAGAPWINTRYPYVVSFDLAKESGIGKPFYWYCNAEVPSFFTGSGWTNLWTRTNKTVPVPVGEWFDLEVKYRSGNSSTGKLIVIVNGQIVFNISNWTRHPQAPVSQGMTHLHPLKLYTSAAIVDHIRNAGGVVQAEWDSLQVEQAWPL